MPDKKLIAITLHYRDGNKDEIDIHPENRNPDDNQALVFWGNRKEGAHSCGYFSTDAAIVFLGAFLEARPDLLKPVIARATASKVLIRRVDLTGSPRGPVGHA